MGAKGEVIEGELLEHEEPNPALIEKALAWPGARELALPGYYEKAIASLDNLRSAAELMEFANHHEGAAHFAQQLKNGDLVEKAKRVTAYTWRRLGDELDRAAQQDVMDGIPAAPRARGSISFLSARRKIAELAGVSKHAENKATQIASIEPGTFGALVEQPGSVSGQDLLKVAKSQSNAKKSRAELLQIRTKAIRREAEKRLRYFAQFAEKHEATALAGNLLGSDRRASILKSATASRDWLNVLIRKLS